MHELEREESLWVLSSHGGVLTTLPEKGEPILQPGMPFTPWLPCLMTFCPFMECILAWLSLCGIQVFLVWKMRDLPCDTPRSQRFSRSVSTKHQYWTEMREDVISKYASKVILDHSQSLFPLGGQHCPFEIFKMKLEYQYEYLLYFFFIIKLTFLLCSLTCRVFVRVKNLCVRCSSIMVTLITVVWPPSLYLMWIFLTSSAASKWSVGHALALGWPRNDVRQRSLLASRAQAQSGAWQQGAPVHMAV